MITKTVSLLDGYIRESLGLFGEDSQDACGKNPVVVGRRLNSDVETPIAFAIDTLWFHKK